MEEHVYTPNRKNKRIAVKRLVYGFKVTYWEQVLWFAVLERAILDIGRTDRYDSTEWFEDKYLLRDVLKYSGIGRNYLFRVLRECSVWP